jgi:hypothetical protein
MMPKNVFFGHIKAGEQFLVLKVENVSGFGSEFRWVKVLLCHRIAMGG